MRKPDERLARRTTARPAVGRLVQEGGFMRLTTGLALVVTVVLVAWTLFYVLWYVLGIPWGPDAPVHLG